MKSTTQPAIDQNDTVVILKKDFDILSGMLSNMQGMQVNERENFRKLQGELSKATIVEETKMPEDVVRLNSIVTIKDLQTKKEMKLTLVIPVEADIREKKVSILAPIGTALIGFRKGKIVSWEVPAGKKDFEITDVLNNQ
ncbi:MAG: nucleoside diphosphate kinase regulator [Bacteroidetes bacterium]|nr:nucleoside diphosphate kinase regulator [Bacteroidota bacterium]